MKNNLIEIKKNYFINKKFIFGFFVFLSFQIWSSDEKTSSNPISAKVSDKILTQLSAKKGPKMVFVEGFWERLRMLASSQVLAKPHVDPVLQGPCQELALAAFLRHKAIVKKEHNGNDDFAVCQLLLNGITDAGFEPAKHVKGIFKDLKIDECRENSPLSEPELDKVFTTSFAKDLIRLAQQSIEPMALSITSDPELKDEDTFTRTLRLIKTHKPAIIMLVYDGTPTHSEVSTVTDVKDILYFTPASGENNHLYELEKTPPKIIRTFEEGDSISGGGLSITFEKDTPVIASAELWPGDDQYALVLHVGYQKDISQNIKKTPGIYWQDTIQRYGADEIDMIEFLNHNFTVFKNGSGEEKSTSSQTPNWHQLPLVHFSYIPEFKQKFFTERNVTYPDTMKVDLEVIGGERKLGNVNLSQRNLGSHSIRVGVADTMLRIKNSSGEFDVPAKSIVITKGIDGLEVVMDITVDPSGKNSAINSRATPINPDPKYNKISKHVQQAVLALKLLQYSEVYFKLNLNVTIREILESYKIKLMNIEENRKGIKDIESNYLYLDWIAEQYEKEKDAGIDKMNSLPTNEDLSIYSLKNLANRGLAASAEYAWKFMDLKKLCLEYNQTQSKSDRKYYLLNFLMHFKLIDLNAESCRVEDIATNILGFVGFGTKTHQLKIQSTEEARVVGWLLKLQAELQLDLTEELNQKNLVAIIESDRNEAAVDDAIKFYKAGFKEGYAYLAIHGISISTENALLLFDAAGLKNEKVVATIASSKDALTTEKVFQLLMAGFSMDNEFLILKIVMSQDPSSVDTAIKLKEAGVEEVEIAKIFGPHEITN